MSPCPLEGEAFAGRAAIAIAAGTLVFGGVLLGANVHPYFYGLSGFIGFGLIFAGVTDWCGMGLLIARAPWNK